jgi:hypothetical protein
MHLGTAKHPQALVTLTIGAAFQSQWQAVCEPGWRRYADRHGYDLICLDQPLDTSARAQARSPAWQKCLILSQPFSQQYERIVWLDADILINAALAPDIAAFVPRDRVGAVASYDAPSRELYAAANARNTAYWRARGATVELDETPAQYYARHGVPQAQHDQVVQTGVLVLSPAHHRDALEATYSAYEQRADWDFQHEMPPLSHELLQREAVHWLDYRFNLVWLLYALMHYPFLFHTQRPRARRRRLARLLDRQLKVDRLQDTRRACATAAFYNSYFLHFAASFASAAWVDQSVSDWREIGLAL